MPIVRLQAFSGRVRPLTPRRPDHATPGVSLLRETNHNMGKRSGIDDAIRIGASYSSLQLASVCAAEAGNKPRPTENWLPHSGASCKPLTDCQLTARMSVVAMRVMLPEWRQ
jgi:hypothetical protein